MCGEHMRNSKNENLNDEMLWIGIVIVREISLLLSAISRILHINMVAMKNSSSMTQRDESSIKRQYEIVSSTRYSMIFSLRILI